METISPVTFLNKDGFKLFGILHKPVENNFPEKAIIILSPGIKSRVAPHRLYLKMANCFVKMGFTVLRFDFSGLGDSEGEISEQKVADFYGTVQVGRYIDDTLAAMDWLEKEHGMKKFILTGLCGGAITGLLTGAKDNRVDSLLGLGIPVILDSSDIDQAKYMTSGQLGAMRKGYLRNVIDPKRWVRFLTFQSDYRTLFKSLWQPLREKIGSSKKAKTPSPSPDEKGDNTESNFNTYFPGALHAMLSSSRKVLLIFSEADRLYWEFEEKYMQRYYGQIKTYSANLEIHVTKKANHVFTFNEWQENMLQKSEKWLSQNY